MRASEAIRLARVLTNLLARERDLSESAEALGLLALMLLHDSRREARLARHPAHRFGAPAELGHTCAYLCSVHAGYINAQNILLDGGSFSGVF